MSIQKFHVAIIGGGLCGLALAIALEKRGISYTLYEIQDAFSETGVGLNVAPNGLEAFNFIEPGLGDEIMALATRNAPHPDLWMVKRLGAATNKFPDAHIVQSIMAPGVGHTAVGRYELLGLLASRINISNAQLTKRLTRIEQDESGASLYFEDGTQDVADVVIGCDGVRSTVRKALLGSAHAPASFAGPAGYRIVLPIVEVEAVLGKEITNQSCVWCGPNAYVVMYSIDHGTKINLGFWISKEKERSSLEKKRWAFDVPISTLQEDFKEWGPAVQKLIGLAGEKVQLWTSHHHSVKLDSYHSGRMCIIGDAAHAMGPHLGQGSSQAMEDACVMAEVLAQMGSSEHDDIPLATQIAAAFQGWEDVRKPLFEWVTGASHETFAMWAGLWRKELSEKDAEADRKKTEALLKKAWNANIKRQSEVAISAMRNALKSSLA